MAKLQKFGDVVQGLGNCGVDLDLAVGGSHVGAVHPTVWSKHISSVSSNASIVDSS